MSALNQLPPGTRVRGALTNEWYTVRLSTNVESAETEFGGLKCMRNTYKLTSGQLSNEKTKATQVCTRSCPAYVNEIIHQ